MKPRPFLLAACALTPVLLSQDNPKSDAKAWEIRGRVVDEAGAAIAGAGLSQGEPGRVTTASTLEAPQVRTQADGTFTLKVPVDRADAQRVLLLAAKGRLAAQLDQRFLVWPASPIGQVLDFGTIMLPRGITMRGTVRQAGGGPIAGARVVAADALQEISTYGWAGAGSVQYAAIGISDEKGLVELPGAAPGGVRVEVEADGYYVQQLPFVAQGDPLVVELRQGGFVEGQVTDAGGQPCGASLLISYETYEPHRGTAQWSEDGKFRISLRHPHRYRVRAYYAADGGLGSLSPVLDGPAKAVEVRPLRAAVGGAKAALVVRITEADSGKAVEKVKAAAIWATGQLTVDEQELEWMFGRMAVEARTPGEIRLAGPKEGEPHTGIVVIKATGFAPTTIRDVKWVLEEQPDDVGVRGQPILEAKLVREAVISGTVVDDAGKPVEGAAVIVDRDDDNSPWFADYGARDGRTSDRDGKFRIGSLGGGKHKLRASVLGRPFAPAIEIEVAASSTLEAVNLVCPRGATLSGRLVGAEAAASAQIVLSKHSERGRRFRSYSDPNTFRRTAVETGGTFKLTGLDGSDYEVELHVPHRQGRGGWHVLPLEPIRIRKNDLQRDFDISESLLGRIRGKIVLAGAPVPRQRLVVVALEHDEDGSRPWDVQGVCEPVAEDGTFELPVAAGQYRVQLLDLATMIPLHVSAVLRVKSATTVEADLTQTIAQVRVRLQPERSGESIVASRLEVAVKHDLAGHNRIRIIGKEISDSRAGVLLSAGEREIDLLLPTLLTKLRVQSNAGAVLGEQSFSDEEPLAELEITPDASKKEEFEIKVAAPKSAKENR